MTNNNVFRKTLIALLAVVTIIVIVILIRTTLDEGAIVSDREKEPVVESKSAVELIAENKYSSIIYSEGGFLEKEVSVPLGGILKIINNTPEKVDFDIRSNDSITTLFVEPSEIRESPVFTMSKEYTISILEEGIPSKEITAKIKVIK